jgi:general secretion pathway protein G
VLERIPPDATFVSLSRTEPEMLLRYVERSGENGEELLDKLYDVLGIDLGPDLLEPLGQTFGLYLSDSTGGGGLTSAVAFAAADDEERLAATLAKLAARLNDAARDELQGRVRARAFERGGAHGYELDIPGLPVPLGPCVALADGQLLLAATPQALDGALRRASGSPHAAETAASWLRHLAPERVGALDGLQSLTYVDTERFAREGYGLAALASAAVANGIRSPQDPTRDPGPVMPPFAELFAGVQPTVLLARVVGEDLVTTGSMDRSLLVHLAATLGWSPVILSGAAAAGLFASLAVPSVTMKLADAELTKAKADIVALKSALDDYALENQGKYPESLEALVVPDEDGFIWIETAEVPPDPWGNPYVYELLPDGARVLSYGADGVPGGEGDAADISSDELQDDEPGWDDEEGMEGDEGEGWMEEEGAEEDDGDEDGL